VPADEAELPRATLDLGRTARKPGTAPGARPGSVTVKGAGPTVVAGTQTPTVLTPTAKRGPATRMTPTAVRPQPAPSGGNPVLYTVLGAMGVALLAAGGYIYIQGGKPPATTLPAATLAVTPSTTPAVIPTAQPPSTTLAVAPPPTTLAPPPPVSGKGTGATALKAAQAAMARNDYDQVIEHAQKALAADTGNAQAKSLIEDALKGQQAEARFAAAETALRQGQLDRAMSEAEAGSAVAPWDSRGPNLLERIRQAKQQAERAAQQQGERAAQQQRVAQVNGFLNRADAALSAQKYDEAIQNFDEALGLDPQNQRAIMGKSSAVQARALSQAGSRGGGGSGVGKSFVPAKTVAQSVETRSGGGGAAEGFDDTPGITVKKGTQAAELPGKILFDIDPEAVKAGDSYTVKVYLLNEGKAPIAVRDLVVNTRINGRAITGAVPAQTKDVAPGDKALLTSMRDLWKENTTSWAMEVTVHTVRGETYKNQVTWK
jgi:tetratricopeptide (TPR) repeat protein